MITAKNPGSLPDSHKLKSACKAMAVLDAILSADWVYRYFSYNSEWAEGEEFFEMRNGEGDQVLILFKEEGAVINGFIQEALPGNKTELTDQLPEIFHEFMYGEPVNSIGTTFCLWFSSQQWHHGLLAEQDDLSEEFLKHFDGEPATYVKWATDYFKGSYKETGIPLETVTSIYNQEPISREMVLTIVEDHEDWEQLVADLGEISYPSHIIL